MANGPSLVDTPRMRVAPEFKAPANNFTSFSGEMLRDAQATISRSPENGAIEDQTVSMSPENRALTDQLMAQIMEKPGPKKPLEVVPQIETKIPQEKKSQNFFARIRESIRNFFKNLFR